MSQATALVTGASGGLGSAIALALAQDGHDIAVHYRSDRAGAERTGADVEAAGRRAVIVSADLAPTEPTELDRACVDLLARTTGALGATPRVLVLNASDQALTPWEHLDTAAWDALWQGTLRHQAALLRAYSEVAQPGSVVVTVGSIEGLRAAPDHTAYAVFKAALHHLTAAAAHELGPRGIRVVGVAPGLVDRPGLSQDWPSGAERWRAAAALGRPVTATEVAAAAAFLASSAASGITGVTLPVDAGWGASPGW